jgi:hypothetical protein
MRTRENDALNCIMFGLAPRNNSAIKPVRAVSEGQFSDPLMQLITYTTNIFGVDKKKNIMNGFISI